MENSSSDKNGIRLFANSSYPLLLGITIISAGFRIYKIDSSFWYDELFSLLNYFRATPIKVITDISNPNNHPLYSLLAQVSIFLFGETEWSVRLPALITGIATPPLIYIFAKRHYDAKTAFVSSLLLSFNMWHIWFSQDARGYSGMIFLCFCSQVLFLRMIDGVRKEKEKITVPLYIVVSACAGYFHLYGAFTPLAHLFMAILLDRFKFKRGSRKLYLASFGALVLTALLYSPALSEMYRYALTEGRNVSGRELTLGYLWRLPVEWTGWGHKPLVAIPLIVLWLVGMVEAWMKRRILFLASCLPLVLALMFIAGTRVFTYYRMQSFYLPWFAVFIGGGILTIAKQTKRFGLVLFCILGCGAVVLNALPIYPYYKFGKQPLKDVAQWVEEKVPPEIPVYSFGLTDSEFRYYCKRAVEIPFMHSIEDAIPRGGIFVSAYPWSWGRRSAELLVKNCKVMRWRSAGYAENDVFVFRCLPAEMKRE